MPNTSDDNDAPDSAQIEEWQDQIDALRDLAKKELTRWELDFLESIDDFLKERGFLESARVRERADYVTQATETC